MKIKSRFKDYYDYIAYQYGGGDPRIVYVRSKITHIDGVERSNLIYNIPKDIKDYQPIITDIAKFNYKWCVVCGTQYLIASPCGTSGKHSTYSVLTEDHPAMQHLRNHRPRKSFWHNDPYVADCHGKSFPDLTNLSRILKSPVFTMRVSYRRNYLEVDDIVPNLKILGFDKLFLPEQMYQNISMWVGNVLRENPDDDPPRSINNEERIIAHGFDLKNSFRNTK